jgi:filamentous hemagglutinin
MAANNAVDAVKAGQGTTIDGKEGQMPVVDSAGKDLPSRDANAADQVGGIGINLSLGGSKSSSKTTQTSNTAAASNLTAGRDIRIEASGGNEQSDITIQGSKVSAARNLTLAAEDEIKLLAAANTNNQKSTNQNSSASVGIGFMVGGTQNGFTIQAGVSGGQGKAKGNDLNWSNTQVEAGQTLTLESGGNTTMKGAVAKGEKVVADIGKDLKIESLQDTSTYDSKQKSLGVSVSLCIPPFCVGTSSGSVSASSSKIESDYASVTEQSGIRAGDQGFDVKVKNDTDLKGGAITSTDKAVKEGKNTFQTGGELTLSDIQNKAEYKAKSASVNVGTSLSFDGALKPGGTSAGFGKDGDKAESMTLAAISDIAGNKEARTGDAETGIAKIFDQQKVQKEIEAQVRITQMFGQLASKAVGDYAETKLKEAQTLRAQGREQEAKDLESQWGANGTLRLAAHTVVGGLTGGASGAAGAAAGTFAAPLVAEVLAKANIDGPLATALTGIASTAVGAAVGGTAGASTALNEVANNYLSHPENADRHKAERDCQGGDQAACTKHDELNALDKQRDLEFKLACDGALSASAGCADATRDLYAKLGTFAAPAARDAASSDKSGAITLAHKEELQSYLNLIKTANTEVRTSTERDVRDPSTYDSDAYGAIDRNELRNTYLIMKFGTDALTIANTREGDSHFFVPSADGTRFGLRNGQSNPQDYAPGLMLAHADAAAATKAKAEDNPYQPIDRFTLSYAPTNGGVMDTAGTLVSKLGIDTAPIVALRGQMQAVTDSGEEVYWVAHSRGGVDYVQAANGPGKQDLSGNFVVFHAGANTRLMTEPILDAAKIKLYNDGYRDSPYDLVPQIVGLRALTNPLNFVKSVVVLPCVFFCSAANSPHTLPYNWDNLLQTKTP